MAQACVRHASYVASALFVVATMSSIMSVASSPRSPPSPGTPPCTPTLELRSPSITPTRVTLVRTRARSRTPPCTPTLELGSPSIDPTIVHAQTVLPIVGDHESVPDDDVEELIALLLDSPPTPQSTPPRARASPRRLGPSDPWLPSSFMLCRHDRTRDQVDTRESKGRVHFLGCKPLGTPLNFILADVMADFPSRLHGEGKYYIGVTCDPLFRFFGPESHKHHHKWKHMFVIAVSSGRGAQFLEQWLLADPSIGLGQFWCTNVGRGGEGVPSEPDPDVPYYLYVVWGTPRAAQ